MGTGNTTVPSARDVAATLRPVVDFVPAFVIAWSALEPHRVGEVAALDVPGPWVLGRASSDLPQLPFVRQRPRASVITGALAGDSLSRRQIDIERASSALALKNVGGARMRVNGSDAISEAVVEGDVVELVGHYVFLVTTRPVTLGDAFDWPAFPFGEPDSLGIVGESPAAWKLRANLAFAAMTNAHVLVHGASGTGKEICAAAIHALSPRARRAFIARNAATFPPGLVDAELFGNAKNYPNAGMPERPGLVGAADGGTLFLDEIGEVPPEVQARLLRLLDSGEYHRLGETHARRANVRLVCATNRPLSALKHNLVPRLKVHIETPSLEARREDIPLLVRHLLLTNPAAAAFVREGPRREVDVAASLVVKLLRERYPTNIRELEQRLVRALRVSRFPPLRLEVRIPGIRVAETDDVPGEPAPENPGRAREAALERHARGGVARDQQARSDKVHRQIRPPRRTLDLSPLTSTSTGRDPVNARGDHVDAPRRSARERGRPCRRARSLAGRDSKHLRVPRSPFQSTLDPFPLAKIFFTDP